MKQKVVCLWRDFTFTDLYRYFTDGYELLGIMSTFKYIKQ